MSFLFFIILTIAIVAFIFFTLFIAGDKNAVKQYFQQRAETRENSVIVTRKNTSVTEIFSTFSATQGDAYMQVEQILEVFKK